MSPEIQSSGLEQSLALKFDYPDLGQSTGSLENWRCPQLVTPTSARFSYRVVKRGCDILIVLLISPIALLLMSVLAVLVLLDSPGPVFFSHSRIRSGGNFFLMWKFRTMCVDSQKVLAEHLIRNPSAREEWKRNHKLRDDPRVSSFGSFMRRTSFDELPQLWNVLIGNMSLVGPRPIVGQEIEKYGSDFAYYAEVKPGITGLWQASGRSKLSYEERVALDRFYVENWSLWLEFEILCKTVKSVFLLDGAY